MRVGELERLSGCWMEEDAVVDDEKRRRTTGGDGLFYIRIECSRLEEHLFEGQSYCLPPPASLVHPSRSPTSSKPSTPCLVIESMSKRKADNAPLARTFSTKAILCTHPRSPRRSGEAVRIPSSTGINRFQHRCPSHHDSREASSSGSCLQTKRKGTPARSMALPVATGESTRVSAEKKQVGGSGTHSVRPRRRRPQLCQDGLPVDAHTVPHISPTAVGPR